MPVAGITLLCVPATVGLRAGRFPADEALDAGQTEQVAALAGAFGRPGRVLCSPARCARQTAQALGLEHCVEPALSEVAYGRWSGLLLKDVAAAEPAELSEWLSDADMNGHGGESIRAFCERVGCWIDQYPWPDGDTLVIAHASVVKAIVLHVLNAPIQAYWQLEVAPLTRTTLSGSRGRWRVTSLGSQTQGH
ncbi:histidine phosphatase family protein [Cupriavidus sp. BIC8F]|uniref:histidine phosphatase family protein n=1 Tax=Cupriavidus sp. BIC8F TaxID=3079014 RepID=UPI0029160B4D|nr:histidine phosphatase family protein [Cupriavidus sp. BIC8F]